MKQDRKKTTASGYWHGRQAVVTGACGFIGSHLAEELARLGADVTALAFYDARGSIGWLADIQPSLKRKIRVVSGDIRDSEQMLSLVKKGSTVFHLAALIGIPYSYEAPRSYIETNITGTLNILEAARRNRAERTLVTSTSEVYGSALRVPIDEQHPLQAQSPYSASKIAAEKIAESYHKSFGLPVTIVRPFNTYGPRQSARAVIPTMLMQALDGRREIALGNATTTRDFNFVKDTVTGMIKLAACRQAIGMPVNIGTGVEISVNETARKIAEVTGRKISIRSDHLRIRPKASEVMRLCADNSLLRSLTGWAPPSRLEEGLRITARWLEPRLGNYDTERYYV